MEIKKCTMCGCEKIKKGKIHGMAAVVPLYYRTGMFGSALIVSFCSKCGEVLDMKVANPDKVKYQNEK